MTQEQFDKILNEVTKKLTPLICIKINEEIDILYKEKNVSRNNELIISCMTTISGRILYRSLNEVINKFKDELILEEILNIKKIFEKIFNTFIARLIEEDESINHKH